jgi:hypothetical protein
MAKHILVFGSTVTSFHEGRTRILVPVAEPGSLIGIGDAITAVGHEESCRGVPLVVTSTRQTSFTEAVQADPVTLGASSREEYAKRWDAVCPEHPAETNPEVHCVDVRLAEWVEGDGFR